jgi:F-type H+-transporting ATPase subunit gamma
VEETERLHERLSNVRAIEPILSALRTIAGATWRAAVSRLQKAHQYTRYIEEVAAHIAPYVGSRTLGPREALSATDKRDALIVISAERGLCGAFNRTILDAADKVVDEGLPSGGTLLLLTLGERATRHFQRRGVDIAKTESLPLTTLLPFSRARELAGWIGHACGRDDSARVRVVFNHYVSPSTYRPAVRQLLPANAEGNESLLPDWPPPIIETDPVLLQQRISEQLLALRLYSAILESAASEQSARLQAMERSSQNAKRLIEDLSLSYHRARQEAITQEMLDLAAGAGMVAGAREEGNFHG